MRKETVITILADRDASKKKRQDVVRPRRRSRFLARRRGGIRFWDMGYMLASGTYIDLPYVDPQSIVPFSGLGPTISPADVPISLTNYASRDSIVFGVDQNDWRSTFKPVNSNYTTRIPFTVHYKGNTYNLSSSSPEWSGGVLRARDGGGTDFQISAAGLFYDGIDLATQKVTDTFDFSASPVTPDLTLPLDVFWFPAFRFLDPLVQITTAPLSPINQYQEYFARAYVTVPRNVIFDATDPYYSTVGAAGGLGSGGQWNGSGLTQYEFTYYHTRWVQSKYNYRAIARQQNGAVYTYSGLTASTFAGASDWPAPPTQPNTTGFLDYILNSAVDSPAFVSGSLVAVIKKGSTYYYIWNQ